MSAATLDSAIIFADDIVVTSSRPECDMNVLTADLCSIDVVLSGSKTSIMSIEPVLEDCGQQAAVKGAAEN